MKTIERINYSTTTYSMLIKECETAIDECRKLINEYSDQPHLIKKYETEISHYEFMIRRLVRHL